jgi:hypothetical protein
LLELDWSPKKMSKSISEPTQPNQTAMFLDLTGFKHTSPCPPLGTRFVAFNEDYQKTGQNIKDESTVKADLRVIRCSTSLAISK